MKYVAVLALAVCGLFSFGARAESAEKIDYKKLVELLAGPSAPCLVDVRTQEEYASGHIPGALLLPVDQVKELAGVQLPDKERAVVVYCRSGIRSANAASELKKLGYRKIYDFGAVGKWQGDLAR